MEVSLLDGVCIECGENTPKMERMIDGDPIQHDEILIRSTAADIEGARKIVQRLHSRQELKRSENVRLHKGRRNLNFPHVKSDGTGLNHFTKLLPLGGDIDLFSRYDGSLQSKIDADILSFSKRYFHCLHLIADDGGSNFVVPRLDPGDDVVALHVGSGSQKSLLNKNVRIREGLTGGFLAYEAADRLSL